MVAVEIFLKIDGIPGEAADKKHQGEIELQSFSWVEANNAGTVGSGGGSGKVQMQDLFVSMPLSQASPKLMLACANGSHHKQAVLTVRKAGGSAQDFLVVTLEDVVVTSYETGGSTPSDVLDRASFAFRTIQMDYRAQKADGSLGPSIKAGWNVKKGKPF